MFYWEQPFQDFQTQPLLVDLVMRCPNRTLFPSCSVETVDNFCMPGVLLESIVFGWLKWLRSAVFYWKNSWGLKLCLKLLMNRLRQLSVNNSLLEIFNQNNHFNLDKVCCHLKQLKNHIQPKSFFFSVEHERA